MRILIVAAMKREIAPLVKGWSSDSIRIGHGQGLKFWRNGEIAVSAVGMGHEKAMFGTKVLIEALSPELVTSVGFAGSLREEWKVGDILVPSQVIGFTTGKTYHTGAGQGKLATLNAVAGVAGKKRLLDERGADSVDMEAAAVAEIALSAGKKYQVIKAVSDAPGDPVELFADFVTPNGFRMAAFLAHVAVRPKLWGAVALMKRNTEKAQASLTAALNEMIAGPDKFFEKYSRTATSAPQGN